MTQRILFPKKATWEELNSLSKENIEKIEKDYLVNILHA